MSTRPAAWRRSPRSPGDLIPSPHWRWASSCIAAVAFWQACSSRAWAFWAADWRSSYSRWALAVSACAFASSDSASSRCFLCFLYRSLSGPQDVRVRRCRAAGNHQAAADCRSGMGRLLIVLSRPCAQRRGCGSTASCSSADCSCVAALSAAASRGSDRFLKVAHPLEGLLLLPLRLPGIRGLAQSRARAVLQPLAGLAVLLKCPRSR